MRSRTRMHSAAGAFPAREATVSLSELGWPEAITTIVRSRGVIEPSMKTEARPFEARADPSTAPFGLLGSMLPEQLLT